MRNGDLEAGAAAGPGILTLRKTHDLTWANAPTPLVSAFLKHRRGWVAPERWRPLGSAMGLQVAAALGNG